MVGAKGKIRKQSVFEKCNLLWELSFLPGGGPSVITSRQFFSGPALGMHKKFWSPCLACTKKICSRFAKEKNSGPPCERTPLYENNETTQIRDDKKLNRRREKLRSPS